VKAKADPLDYRIRRMRVEDVEVVHRIDMQSFSLPWPENAFRYEVTENANARLWVAEVPALTGKQVIGMICIWLVLDEAHIATIAVDPDYRRKGIGEGLLLHGLRQTRQEGAVLAYLEVRRSNVAAQKMYKKYGFEVAGMRTHYYADNQEDAILMTLGSLGTIVET
jgi:ribosomal-protein-alanine N-acetyltransferase